MVRGAHGRFPNFAFLQLAIAQHRVNARGIAFEPKTQRHAERHGESLSKRACAGFDPRQVPDMGMTLKGASQFAQAERFSDGAKGEMRARSIERRCGVSFRQHEAVACGVVALARPNIQFRTVKRREKIGCGKTPAGMTRARMIDRCNRDGANGLCRGRKFFD